MNRLGSRLSCSYSLTRAAVNSLSRRFAMTDWLARRWSRIWRSLLARHCGRWRGFVPIVKKCSVESNSKGATSTHLPVAPSKRHRPFAPSRIGNANCGASNVVRSLCGEVTSPTLRASCVAGHTHETFSNLRNLLCVKLAYDCCNQNAMQ